MKVYIMVRDGFPYGMAATNRVICYAKGLIANGIPCEVIVVRRTEVYGKPILNLHAQGSYQNIPFRYIGGHTQRSKSRFCRVISDWLDVFRIWKFCQTGTESSDVILNYLREDRLNWFILNAAHRNKVKVIRELCEYPYGGKRECSDKTLKRIFKKFDGFIVISEALKKVAEKYKSEKARIIKVPILVNESRFEEGTEKVDVGVPYLFHAGTLTEYKDAVISTLKAFIIAVNEIKIPVKYLLAGPVSPHKREIEGLLYEHRIENRVIFLGNLKPSEVIKYQKGAFLTVVNKNDNIQNRYGFSTKLGEILWSGTPVITTTVGEANYYLKDGESAYIVEPHNPRLIAEKIIQAFSNPEESRKIAEAGKKIAQDSFNCLSQGKRLASFFSSFSF